MDTAHVTYLGGLSCEAVHPRSGQRILSDAPPDNQGKGGAFSPSDLLCTSLACCMMTIMGIVAARDGVDLKGTQIEITKTMTANPRRIGRIEVYFILASQVILNETQKEKLQRAALTCPVALSLHPDIEQEVRFDWNAALQEK